MLPSLVLKNQFGETSNNFIEGGSSQLWCNFVVDSANGNGLGIRSLKGNGVKAIFMHTSATALGGNPNPAAGYIVVELEENYSGYVNGTYGFAPPVSGTPVNISGGLTQFGVYTIVSLGTSNQANWVAIGLRPGITAAVGVSFVASTASAGTGTGTVEVVKSNASVATQIQPIGDPNLMCNPSDNSGAIINLATLGATNSSTTTLIPIAVADGTVIGLTFNMTPVPQPLI